MYAVVPLIEQMVTGGKAAKAKVADLLLWFLNNPETASATAYVKYVLSTYRVDMMVSERNTGTAWATRVHAHAQDTDLARIRATRYVIMPACGFHNATRARARRNACSIPYVVLHAHENEGCEDYA